MGGPSTGAGSGEVVRVVVIDDHQMFATSLAQALDAEPGLRVVAVASSAATGAEAIAANAPDVVLLDHRLPDADGVAEIESLRRLRPSAKVVVLTASTSDRLLVRAMEAGAAGFLEKTQPLEDVIAGVRAAAQGELVVKPQLLGRLLPRLRRNERRVGSTLTEREQEILELLAEGRSNADIASHLHLSVHTVRNHVANLSAKLDAHSKLEVLAIAVRNGLVSGA
jgi:DNA-binding NarL/FixJ family response regulator